MGREALAERGGRAPLAARITLLKALQLAVAVSILVLLLQIYPGVLAIGAGALGACYILAALAASRDRPAGVWLAFAFSALTFAFSGWGVYRYFDNGFNWLAGNFAGRVGVYWPAYLFLLVALGALAVIVLHVVAWRWMIRPRQNRGRL